MNVMIKNHETLVDKTYRNIVELKIDGDNLYLYCKDGGLVDVIDTNTSTVII
jgi:hypothetical protein